MPVLLDEAGAEFLDEGPDALLDEAGAPIGVLTAADATLATLTAADATLATLRATDVRTGGPS